MATIFSNNFFNFQFLMYTTRLNFKHNFDSKKEKKKKQEHVIEGKIALKIVWHAMI